MEVLEGWALEKALCGFMEGQRGSSAEASQLCWTRPWEGWAGPDGDMQGPGRDSCLLAWPLPPVPAATCATTLARLSLTVCELELIVAATGVV